jgi:hypothetical protein
MAMSQYRYENLNRDSKQSTTNIACRPNGHFRNRGQRTADSGQLTLNNRRPSGSVYKHVFEFCVDVLTTFLRMHLIALNICILCAPRRFISIKSSFSLFRIIRKCPAADLQRYRFYIYILVFDHMV